MELDVNCRDKDWNWEDPIHLIVCFSSSLFQIVIYKMLNAKTKLQREPQWNFLVCVYAFEMTYDDSLFTIVTLTSTSNNLFML